jgi:putative endonuclease
MNPKYKKMLEGMRRKDQASKKKIRDKWLVYILQCQDGSFYTGITKDMNRRLKMHNDGKASRYTRIRRPVKLCYQEVCFGRALSLIRECQIKSLPRSKKEELINK